MAPEPNDFLCGDWMWDASLRELRHFTRRGKGWAAEPDATEKLPPVKAVRWYKWSQAPMATHTGQSMPGSLSRVVAEYEGGGNLTLSESDRECAAKLARAIAGAFRLPVIEEGAPSGRLAGNLPGRDQMGRLVNRAGRLQVTLDDAAGEITVVQSKRLFGKSRRTVRKTEVRRLEMGYEVKGPLETFTVWAVAGPEEERIPLASYQGYEGWADPEEWKGFTRELGQKLGVETRVDNG